MTNSLANLTQQRVPSCRLYQIYYVMLEVGSQRRIRLFQPPPKNGYAVPDEPVLLEYGDFFAV